MQIFITVKELREKINAGTITEFDLKEAVKTLSVNAESIPLGAEMAFKNYIRKGVEILKVDKRDIQAVYNSFGKQQRR